MLVKLEVRIKMSLKLVSDYKPAGDQQKAIDFLTSGVKSNVRDQVLVGVTGSGKTFTIANVIEKLNRPTLIMTHNKTLASQLYSEMLSFFPGNAVEFFISDYDFYQPEAYMPLTEKYIAKSASTNEEITRIRHAAIRAIIERKDVIIVASVSCIFAIGSIENYAGAILTLKTGSRIQQKTLCRQLVSLHYQKNNLEFKRGVFRSTDNIIEIFPAHQSDTFWKLKFLGDTLENISEMRYPSHHQIRAPNEIKIFPNSLYAVPSEMVNKAIGQILIDLKNRLKELKKLGKLIEKERLEQKVLHDIELIRATGICPGIENYSRYFTGRITGEPPPTFFEYLPKDSLLIVDESHVSVPQIQGMFLSDRARKQTLVDYGFRLPSCMDNRPLKFEEWDYFRPQTIFLSATPGEFEITRSGKDHIVEQLIRPTGILDPLCVVRPRTNQLADLIQQIKKTISIGFRTLVTTLTKKMAKDITEYLLKNGIKVSYMHSETESLDRIEIIKALKSGEIDVLVGINLLREGLDIPECTLIAILDADKEGYLRSKTALMQTIGRVSRNVKGRVVMYADRITNSMKNVLDEVERRRKIQNAFNIKNHIIPTSIVKSPLELEKSAE